MNTFKIIPILGRRTNVPPDDASLFRFVSQGLALTHDVGGVNFDIDRKKNACSKSYGRTQWSNTVNAKATKCMGLFELYDGTNTNHVYFDSGSVFVYDGSNDPVDVSAATTFYDDSAGLYSCIRVGAYFAFADWAEHTPYRWKHGDANVAKLITAGTEYKFRYLESFQRRVIGAYSSETDGNIEIRWSSSWPGTAITSLTYTATDQLYMPNDDPITGIAVMGSDRCYVYCENSIQQIFYYPDYSAPFRIITAVPKQGFTNHHSIINFGDRHYGFNKNYGFCEYRGNQFPVNGRPISESIESELDTISSQAYNFIVGSYVPGTTTMVWSVPINASTSANRLFFYNYLTGQWTVEDKVCRYLDNWSMYTSYTWNQLISDLGGTGALWSALGSGTLGEYAAPGDRLVMANTNGHLYQRASEADVGAALIGYRVEPILHFGDPNRFDILNEIWFDVSASGNFSIDVSHRSGDTTGEVIESPWVEIGSVSCDNNSRSVLTGFSKPARLHQIKWGTDREGESFQVNGITFKFTMDSTV